MEFKTDILLDGLKFPEGPRWHENKLWFSDKDSLKVMKVDIDDDRGSVDATPVELPRAA